MQGWLRGEEREVGSKLETAVRIALVKLVAERRHCRLARSLIVLSHLFVGKRDGLDGERMDITHEIVCGIAVGTDDDISLVTQHDEIVLFVYLLSIAIHTLDPSVVGDGQVCPLSFTRLHHVCRSATLKRAVVVDESGRRVGA